MAAIAVVLGNRGLARVASNRYVRGILKIQCSWHQTVKHRFMVWSLSKVLQALTKPLSEPLSKAELKFLAWKVVFLVAVTSVRNVSELGHCP